MGLPLGNLENREHTHGSQPLSTSSDGEHNHQWSEYDEDKNNWSSFNRDGGFDFIIGLNKGVDNSGGGLILSHLAYWSHLSSLLALFPYTPITMALTAIRLSYLPLLLQM